MTVALKNLVFFSIACETIEGNQYRYISFNLGSLIAINKDSEVLVMRIKDKIIEQQVTAHSRNNPELGTVASGDSDWAMFMDLFSEFNNGEAMIVRHSGVLSHNTVRFILLDPDKAISKLRQACEPR